MTSGATPGFRQIEKVARDSCGGVPGRWRSGPSDRLFFWLPAVNRLTAFCVEVVGCVLPVGASDGHQPDGLRSSSSQPVQRQCRAQPVCSNTRWPAGMDDWPGDGWPGDGWPRDFELGDDGPENGGPGVARRGTRRSVSKPACCTTRFNSRRENTWW